MLYVLVDFSISAQFSDLDLVFSDVLLIIFRQTIFCRLVPEVWVSHQHACCKRVAWLSERLTGTTMADTVDPLDDAENGYPFCISLLGCSATASIFGMMKKVIN